MNEDTFSTSSIGSFLALKFKAISYPICYTSLNFTLGMVIFSNLASSSN